MDLPPSDKVKLLKNDILNGPFHVFGLHDKCDRLENIFKNKYYLLLFYFHLFRNKYFFTILISF